MTVVSKNNRKNGRRSNLQLWKGMASTLFMAIVLLSFTHGRSHDAAVVSVDSLYNPCPGKTAVYATVSNAGDEVIDSVTLSWSLNGDRQGAFKLRQTLGKSQDTSIYLGDFKAESAKDYNILVSSSKPNGKRDANPNNDEAKKSIALPMSGNFTIGSRPSDYSRFSDALNDLKQYGVCGPVKMTIKAGTHHGPFEIKGIDGLSRSNTLTFKGAGKTQTEITANTSGGWIGRADPTIAVSGSDYITFQKMKIENTGEGNAFNALNNAEHITVKSCYIKTPVSLPGFSDPGQGINVNGSNDVTIVDNFFYTSNGFKYSVRFQNSGDKIKIKENNFHNWGIGAIFVSDYSNVKVLDNTLKDTVGNIIGRDGITILAGDLKDNVEVKNNEIKKVRETGIQVEDINSAEIKNNKVYKFGEEGIRVFNCKNAFIEDNHLAMKGKQAGDVDGVQAASINNLHIKNNQVDSATGEGITCNQVKNALISRNRIERNFGPGLSTYNCSGTDFQNNMVLHKGSGSAVIIDSSKQINFYHNSVKSTTGDYVLHLRKGKRNNIKNNNFKGGQTVCVKETNAKGETYNGNNYDHPSILFKSGNQQFATLKIWRQNEFDQNDLGWSKNARFKSNEDLHLKTGKSFLRGVNLRINEDYDGDNRCLANPSVGADESNIIEKPDSLEVSVPDTGYYKSPFEVKYEGDISGNFKWYLNGKQVAKGVKAKLSTDNLGTNKVKITHSFCNLSDTTSKDIEIVKPHEQPKARFFAENTDIFRFDTVKLKDFSSKHVAGWRWDVTPVLKGAFPRYRYVEGTDDKSQNPEIWFLRSGLYDVCLAVYNLDKKGNKRWDTLCRTDYIEVNEEKTICNGDRSKENHNYLFDDGGKEGTYSNNQNCAYTINPCTDTVKLTIKEFDLQKYADYLRIYDGKSDDGEPLWNVQKYGRSGISGNKDNAGFDTAFTATSGSVYVEFSTDANTTRKGFKLEWESTGNNYKVPKASIGGKDTVCKGYQHQYFSQSETNNTSHVSRNWYLNDFDFAEVGKRYQYEAKSAGNDTLYLVTRECGLADTTRKIIHVRDPQQINQKSFSANNQTPDVGTDVVSFDYTASSCGKDVEWKFQPSDKVQFVNSTNAHSKEPDVIFHDTGCFDVKLVVSNDAVSDSLKKSCYINPVDYCTPNVMNTNPDAGISFFSLNEIANASTNGKIRYQNFSKEQTTYLTKGVNYDVTVKRNTNLHAVSRKIWVDFDKDGSFDSKQELVAEQHGSLSFTWNPDFTVPASAEKGVTKLRVGTFLKPDNGSCGTPAFGEYEDYGIRIIKDQEPPEITLDGNNPIRMQACQSLANFDTGAKAMDNRDGNLTARLKVDNQVDTAVAGEYQINYSATDNHGNTGTKSRKVIVKADTTKPEISLKDANPYVHLVGNNFAEPGYQTSDNCSGVANLNRSSTVNQGEVGTYEVTYLLKDEAGNQAKTTRTVLVKDTLEPSVSLKGDDPYEVLVDSSFNDPGVQYSDNYWGQGSITLTKSGTVNTSKVGNYELTYSVTDSSGNGPVSRSRTVKVQDTFAPKVSATTEDTLKIRVFTSVEPSDVIANVADNYYEKDDLSLIKQGDYYTHFKDGKADSLGLFEMQWVYSDPSGNQKAVTKMVEVVDKTAPEISLKGQSYVKIQRWKETSYVDSYKVTDNYYGKEDITVRKKGSYFSDYIQEGYPSGTYEIRYQAEDSSGNQSGLTFRYVETIRSTGVKGENDKNLDVEAYPNPSNGRVNISFKLEKEKELTIQVLDQTGSIIRDFDRKKVREHDFRINMANEAAGIYLLKVEGNGIHQTKQIELVR